MKSRSYVYMLLLICVLTGCHQNNVTDETKMPSPSITQVEVAGFSADAVKRMTQNAIEEGLIVQGERHEIIWEEKNISP